jgi:hypothetical protein
MSDETCIPVMMRLIGEGSPVVLTGRFAVLLVLPVVLLWAMMGVASPASPYIVLPEPGTEGPEPGPARSHRRTGGIFPANAGTAGGPRALLAR